MVPEAGRTIAEKLECLKVAVAYMAKRRFDVVRSFSFSFQIVDLDDEVDDDAIAEAVYREPGIGTEWFPHRAGDTPKPVTTETTLDIVTTQDSATVATQNSTITDESVCVIRTYTCPMCKKSFKNKHAKYIHVGRGKCIVTQASA